MKKILLPAALILASGIALAQARTFEELDADKSGSLSKDEAATVEGLDFDAADANKDGALSQEEYTAATGGAEGGGEAPAEGEKPAG
jgi:hypothetical protein